MSPTRSSYPEYITYSNFPDKKTKTTQLKDCQNIEQTFLKRRHTNFHYENMLNMTNNQGNAN